ncbi:pyrimidine/purine nucleotide monophosphate nucleosidase domain-containing protein, partial [Klebsiella pneumoniae]|uniref:pyrimidine/purine nucleotide monophosphate nucleosidase domain-containing protein n=1 Tax=Klebsiella pneumoniae TaxID=573 RepID=UPI0022EA5AA1
RAFSGIVAGNVKEVGIQAIEQYGPYKLHGDPEMMRRMDDLLHKTNFGRRTYAIGNNPTGAWFSGINVKRHNLVLFALVGLM